jgi:hypothetical protein
MTDLGMMGGDLGLLDGGLEAPLDVLRVSTVMVPPFLQLFDEQVRWTATWSSQFP